MILPNLLSTTHLLHLYLFLYPLYILSLCRSLLLFIAFRTLFPSPLCAQARFLLHTPQPSSSGGMCPFQ